MNLDQLRHPYENHYASLRKGPQAEAEAERVVGGDFEAVGSLEYYALKAHGLRPEHSVVDIGCGTGRLAIQLSRRGHQHYAGFDIVAEAVNYARQLCQQPTWTFGVTAGLRIEVPRGEADFACFFSVFTHVSHEHTFLYLAEARRILKMGGLVVFTFLEFSIGTHWTQFEAAVSSFGSGGVPVVFLDRSAITRFAAQLKFEVIAIVDGDVPTFPIEEVIVASDGRCMRDLGYLGQSLAVLRKM